MISVSYEGQKSYMMVFGSKDSWDDIAKVTGLPRKIKERFLVGWVLKS